jgi:hypothetical protein
MTSQHTADTKVARSERQVREVADSWNAVDLSAVAQCLSILNDSVADLSDAHRILKEVAATSADSVRVDSTRGDSLRSDIAGLKASALRLERLVDASAAFLRLAPGLASEDVGLYRSGGAICSLVSPGEPRGIQG